MKIYDKIGGKRFNDNCQKSPVLVNFTGRRGGGALTAYELTKALIENGNKVVAVISETIENLEDWKKLNIEKLVVIPTYDNKVSYLINSFLFYFKQRRKIKKEFINYNIQNVLCPMDTLWSQKVINCFRNTKVVMCLHDPKAHEGTSIIERFLGEKHVKKSDAVIVFTKKFMDDVIKKYNKPTYYTPLGRHNIYKDCENKKQLVAYDENMINFVFFGRITPYKGLDTLAKAYRIVCEQLGEKVSLTICGNGDFSPYETLYDKLPNVKIVNQWIHDEEVESIFTGSNLVSVCPYSEATQSGVVLVSLDYGVPVIATKTGGLDEQIKDGYSGFLVETNNATQCADAMIKLANEEDLRKEMSCNCIKQINELSWNNSAKLVTDIMENLWN